MFGTISPTNEIIPAIDTADAARTEATTIQIFWINFKFNPSDKEISLPNESMLRSFDSKIAETKPTIINPIV